MNERAEGAIPSSHLNLEVEVKFLVPDLDAFRERLLPAGATLHRGRTYERNVRFDTADDALLEQGSLLRLREDVSVTLTYKGKPESGRPSEAKVFEELEVRVDDFNMTAAILNRLGYSARQVYEKYRETYRLGQVEIVLDEMPFGDFVELEGEEVAIKSVAEQLELPWSERITTNYLALMSLIKSRYALPFDDLTFNNFAECSVSIADVLA